MKKLFYFLVSGLMCLTIGCNRSSVDEIDSLAKYRDTLIGKFNGVEIDTLIAEPIDSLSIPENDHDIYGGLHYKWRIYTKKGTVKDFILEGLTTGVEFIAEGDLDGNGTDEWGLVPQYPTSNWKTYHVFTSKDSHWVHLFKPESIWLGDLIDEDDDEESSKNKIREEDIASPTDKPGWIKVKFSTVNYEGDFLLLDTLINTKEQVIYDY